MAKVRVYNDNVHTFTQKFMDENIEIEPGKFILMDEHRAVKFKGHYSPIELDGNGQPMPTSFKMIRLEKIGPDEKPRAIFKCMACEAPEFQDQVALDAHIDSKHSEVWVDQDFKDKKSKQAKDKHA